MPGRKSSSRRTHQRLKKPLVLVPGLVQKAEQPLVQPAGSSHRLRQTQGRELRRVRPSAPSLARVRVEPEDADPCGAGGHKLHDELELLVAPKGVTAPVAGGGHGPLGGADAEGGVELQEFAFYRLPAELLRGVRIPEVKRVRDDQVLHLPRGQNAAGRAARVAVAHAHLEGVRAALHATLPNHLQLGKRARNFPPGGWQRHRPPPNAQLASIIELRLSQLLEILEHHAQLCAFECFVLLAEEPQEGEGGEARQLVVGVTAGDRAQEGVAQKAGNLLARQCHARSPAVALLRRLQPRR
mmetsp:Transcript_15777/g.47358  ORF Transcript_15777/g.47358 Transcript_15777/m.47358 type:complete len:298 (+) Transcript_15777:234-1127(+)|eukprot:CAMPEP_0175192508 /NCGR_PEP_ID=MMETSP0093-20121207/5487_1 /TAXON_ID=311494 /ORGANISM="Alexandrium monilatum, Strain CCMP3105" /LENGTH=297 /DNA_ID=CAMNT_0016485351 /DNA_START=184 /DNA_END=1077 /DNA_ORIENTATION=-